MSEALGSGRIVGRGSSLPAPVRTRREGARRRSADAPAANAGIFLRLARFARRGGIIALVVGIAVTACGKKGPPLPPFVRIPAAVETIDARRVGGDVYVTLTIPASNIDESVPAAVGHVEVYGYTAAAEPARGRFLERAALVASIEVFPAAAGDAAQGSIPAPGATVTVRDTLSADELLVPPVDPPASSDAAVPPPAPGDAGPPRRFYMAIAFSERGTPGPQGAIAAVPLAPPPDPPDSVAASYTADTVRISWGPSGGLIGFLLERSLPPEPPPFGVPPPADGRADAMPPAPVLYNVYRTMAPDPLALPGEAENAGPIETPPLPVNPTPLATMTYTEPVVLDDLPRCYTVRAVRGAPPAAVEGVASRPACLRPIDVFPPAPPAGLSAIATERAISLIWEPNAEPDLAGYLVLRGAAGDDTLAPLTPGPVSEARFTDDTVQPGTRYVYHVIAVDDRVPLANRSAPAIIEETAR